ncbi:HlyD family efflux transporter periplasmic adaptor subunit [Plantactinospora sp. B5E13]|uniref:efflux RND transporter periplasmic adaptor subunit n=1 Tax=Plantactinospora sp. B5E13 TaxID=3153758 RepID=UPI00325D8D70
MRHTLPRLRRPSLPRLRTSPALIVNVILALAVAGAATWAYTSFSTAEAAEPGSGGSRTVAAAHGTVTATVSAAGSVRSASTATATFATSGTVTAIRVQVGDKVTKGQALAVVDDTAARRQFDAARANLDAAQAALDRAQDADGDTSEAEAQVDQAELDVDEAEDAVAGTTLKAPMAGTVTAVNGTVGGSASGNGGTGNNNNTNGGGNAPGGTSNSGGDTGSGSVAGFIEIADLTRLEVFASIAEADATKLKTGQTGTVTWNALPEARSTAKLAAVDPNATTANNVVTYGVTFTLDDLPDGVRAGQSVNVSVTVGQAANVVYVNSAAVTSAGNRHTVTVMENGQRTVRAVEVGLEGDNTTEITSGLTAGEQVLIDTPSNSSNQGTSPGGGFPGGGAGPGGGFPGGGGPPGGGRLGGGR